MVRVTGPATQGGVYLGNIIDPPTSDVPAGSDAESSDVGTAGEDILIINVKEYGSGSHDLTDDASNTDLDCIGVYLITNDDGTKVYAVDKIWIGCQATDELDGGTA
jgi:hypothetical protein